MSDLLYDKFIEIFGEYEPIVTEVQTGVYETSINWGYVGAVAFVLVLLFGILAIIGGLLKGRK